MILRRKDFGVKRLQDSNSERQLQFPVINESSRKSS